MKKKKIGINDICKVISKFVEDNNKQVGFIGSFWTFDKEGNVKDDSRIFAYSDKECIKITMEELNRLIKEDKEDFINW